jgi:hypothetical protein
MKWKVQETTYGIFVNLALKLSFNWGRINGIIEGI